MKKIIVIICCLIFTFSTSQGQSNRLELGPHPEENNWLFYTKPNSGQLEIAPRKTYDGGSWGYDWSKSLLYTKAGELRVGHYYGFRDQNGRIGFNSDQQAYIDFHYSGSSINSGQLILAFGTAASSAMNFGSNTSNGFEKLMSLSQGSNGLGLLTIKGHLHSREVKVAINAGPDYVFESDYELRSLLDTKKFIEDNKHLPEVPSAKEMEASGVELGQMNMLLLKKIEELTLYQIELLERLEHAEEKIQELESKN
ncbi:hypothetical protein [Reichenbachiella ulvae]|uniref:MORN repeat-containing protein n=1 Tax=Reichenbachiella ulvae TaxID=2980104 RepID=A0ABT3CUY0_9BACT|nr:hypothetical protein [Reichenbachiella ulvae]MCV9387483.1 hypothetical protein [Reichenbachiella ulvae]